MHWSVCDSTCGNEGGTPKAEGAKHGNEAGIGREGKRDSKRKGDRGMVQFANAEIV